MQDIEKFQKLLQLFIDMFMYIQKTVINFHLNLLKTKILSRITKDIAQQRRPFMFNTLQNIHFSHKCFK